MRRAVELALDAARGLAYLHKRKPSPIVHRDLKPANLMISGNLYQVRPLPLWGCRMGLPVRIGAAPQKLAAYAHCSSAKVANY